MYDTSNKVQPYFPLTMKRCSNFCDLRQGFALIWLAYELPWTKVLHRIDAIRLSLIEMDFLILYQVGTRLFREISIAWQKLPTKNERIHANVYFYILFI